MSRDLTPGDLLPAIANVAGGLVVSLVLAEAARLAAEAELARAAEEQVPWPRPNGHEPAATGPRTPAGESRVP